VSFFLRFLSGVVAELKATAGVWALLRRRFWVAYTLLLLATLSVTFLPGVAAPIGSGLLALAMGLGAIFSGWAGNRVRRWNWIHYPDGPEVVPYLSQALAILLFPTFFLATASFFHSLTPYVPGLHATTWPLALAITIDNGLYTQIFFDFFECFHIRLGPKPDGYLAPTIIFIIRTLLDVAFIKLTVQLIRAAYFRALDFGRGGDLIAQTQEACEADDVSAARLHSREVGQSVRAAAEDLRSHHDAGGAQAEQAWLGLRAMKAFAISYFEDRAVTQLGEDRARTQAFVDRLKVDHGPEPEPLPVPWLGRILLVVVYVVLASLTYLAFFAPPAESWPLALALTFLQGWFLVRPRWWLDRLDSWHILPAGSPGWLPFRILIWLLLLTPLFMVNSSEVIWLVGKAVPSAFGATRPGEEADPFEVAEPVEVTIPAALEFVVENLLHAQIFADTVEIYRVRITRLHQQGVLGGALTFLLRLVFNIGLLSVLVPFLLERFNQWFRGIKTRPDAELLLRREARNCGPHSAMLVAYYFRQVRDWFVEEMNERQDQSGLLGALAASGFVRDFQARYPEGTPPSEDPTADVSRQLERGRTLFGEGMINEGEQEVRKAIAALDELLAQGRTDLDELTAFARYVQGQLAVLRAQPAEAEAHLRESWALIKKLGGEQVGSALSARLAEVLDLLAIVVGQSVPRAAESLGYAERSVEVFQHFVSQGVGDYRELLAGSLGTRGQALLLLQRWDESVESFKKAIAILEEIQAQNVAASAEGLFGATAPKRPEVRDTLAQRRLELSAVYRELRRFPDAADEARKAIVLLEDLLREGNAHMRDPLARTLNQLGLSLNDAGKSDEAQLVFERARQLCEQLILEHHDNQRRLLAPLLNNLGLLLVNKGQAAQAEMHFRRAIEHVEKLLVEGQAQQQELLVTVYNNLAQALMQQKKRHEAKVEVGKAIEIGRNLVNAGQTTLRDELALVLSNLGDLMTLDYQWGPAVDAFRESARWYAEVVDGGAEQYRPLRARALDRLSISLRLFGEIDQAEEQGAAAVEQFRILVNAGKAEYRGELAGAIRTLGLAHHANRNFEKAMGLFQEANILVASDSPEDRIMRANLLVDVAATQEAQDQPRDAIQSLDRAIILQAQLVDQGRKELEPDLGRLLNHRGDLLYNEGDIESALTAYREAVRRIKPLVDAGNKGLREDLAGFHADVARGLAKIGEPGWAEAYQASLALYGVLVREGDPGAADRYYPITEALVYYLTAAKRMPEAELALRQGAGIYAAASADPLNHRARLGEARTRLALALHLAEVGKQAEFRAESETTLTLLEALLRLPEPPDKALRQYRESFGSLVRRYEAQNSLEDADRMATRSLTFLDSLEAVGRGGLTGALVDALELLADVQQARGDKTGALATLKRAQEHMPNDPFDMYSLESPTVRIFGLLVETGQDDEATNLARTALSAMTAEVGETPDEEHAPEARTLSGWHRLLGSFHGARGQKTEALTELHRALTLLGANPEPSDLAGTLGDLAAVAPEEGLPRARKFVESIPGPENQHPATVIAVRTLIERIHLSRPDDATWMALRTKWAAEN
jgi:tetratricopeptide (TPR) repeat protein